ncbi:MAG TPA: hypothetical protein VEB66_05540 [Opitutaceae bacterium]|nr:hypothetical protein [Opitutaceae bacterium]
MKPDNKTPRGQGAGTPREQSRDAEHRGAPARADTATQRPGRRRQTGGEEELHDDHLDSSGQASEAARESPGNTAPAIRHPNRPEREKSGGNYNGPSRGRA